MHTYILLEHIHTYTHIHTLGTHRYVHAYVHLEQALTAAAVAVGMT